LGQQARIGTAVKPEELAELEAASAQRAAGTGLALGWLAMAPLLAAYEWGLAQSARGLRNTGERLVLLAFEPLGDAERYARWGVVVAGLAAAALVTRARGVSIRAGVARIVLEGLACAVVLGPVLVALLALGSGWLPRLDVAWKPVSAPPLDTAALLFGGAAWEELCFRVGGYGIAYLLARAACGAAGLGERASAWIADTAGLALSSAVFAAAHLRRFTGWLGAGGAEFDPALFTWLCLAGILLGLIFRLRGPGVAAWAHGLFNVALLAGVDPDVLS
jgi:hypothetical protein